MERSSSACGDKKMNINNNDGGGFGLKKGLWTPEEDQKLLSYIQQFGEGRWRSLSADAGKNPSIPCTYFFDLFSDKHMHKLT